MKIDYVIISSDDNPLYKDFYEVVSKQWNKFGFKTYYINITNIDEIKENEYGIIHKIKKIENVPTGLQSQIVRLFSSNFIYGNILISDIDMLPLNGDYFNSYLNQLTDKNIILYSGQPYGNVPFYPMCYVLSNTITLKTALNIGDLTFEEFCHFLVKKYNSSWNTDEQFLYDSLKNFNDNLIIKSRDFNNRIDRSNWVYNDELLKNSFYIDSHLLRPYSEFKEQINILINKIN